MQIYYSAFEHSLSQQEQITCVHRVKRAYREENNFHTVFQQLKKENFNQKWHLFPPRFEPNKPTPGNEEDNTVSWETGTIFYISAFQYLTLCIAYSPGHPFRQPIYTNCEYMLFYFLFICCFICLYLYIFIPQMEIYLFLCVVDQIFQILLEIQLIRFSNYFQDYS